MVFNYIKTHWNGNHPLPQAFWINYIGQNLALKLLVPSHLVADFLIVAVGAWVWGLVGTWRAARKFKGSSIWIFLTWLFLFFGFLTVLFTVLMILKISILPSSSTINNFTF